MLLMHWLERMDVLPPSDFGVREGYRVFKSLLERPRRRRFENLRKPRSRIGAWLPGICGAYRARVLAHIWNAVRTRRI